MAVLDKNTIEALRQKGKDSLFFLCRAILGFTDFTEDIHKPICDQLQDWNNKRVMIILPRDWFKSSLGSVGFCIWSAINNPNVRILVVQNSMTNAKKKLQSIKQMIEGNDLLTTLYPHLLPRKNSVWSGECLTVNRDGAFPEGTFEAAGTGTAVTSRHFDIIIEDDTVSPEIDDMTGVVQQPTALEIEKAIGFHRLTHPLLLHPSESKIVVIGTRWAENDLLGWIEKNAKNFLILSRSARENGEPIWDRYNNDVLDELEVNIGPYMFSTLFMNNPIMNLNAVFKREWMRYYETLPKNGIIFCTSVDPAATEKEQSSDPDYSIVITTAVNENTGDIYVVHYTRDRMNPGELVDAIIDHYRAYKPVVVKVEGIAYQRTLGYWLKKRPDYLKMPFYVEVIKGMRGSKEDRIRGLQPYFAADKIALKPTMGELERELLAFPHGSHDDIIDALSMHLSFWHRIGESKRVKEESANDTNDFSGQAIINELLGRQVTMNRFPNDVGNPYMVKGDSRFARARYAHN
jgi:predicted phage terminase large subunit-like protein